MYITIHLLAILSWLKKYVVYPVLLYCKLVCSKFPIKRFLLGELDRCRIISNICDFIYLPLNYIVEARHCLPKYTGLHIMLRKHVQIFRIKKRIATA
jgi:hypothetical protein